MNLLLRNGAPIYAWALWLQVAAYALVLLAHLVHNVREIGPVRIGYYFVQANLALAHAAILFIAGRRIVVWDPSVR